MSSRAFRKLAAAELSGQQQQIERDEEDDELEEEEIVPAKRVANAFDLLMAEEDVDDLPEDAPEEVAEFKPTQRTSSTTTSKKKKPANKKKQKKKGAKKDETKPQKEEEDIDELIKQFGSQNVNSKEGTRDKEQAPEKVSIFHLEAPLLNPDNELRKLFGKQTVRTAIPDVVFTDSSYQIKEATKDATRRVAYHKKLILVRPKENWPMVPSGLSMEFIEAKKGVNYFKVVWNATYRRVQEQFYVCVQSYDPNSFSALLQVFPYHIDSLLQLSEVCKQTGQFEMSMDLLERALFAFENAWSPLFNPLLGNCRLDYNVDENKPFFLALFRYIQMLGREGTSRTALEYCKLLLSLDLTDPLFVLFIIDYYGVRSQQYEHVLRLFSSDELNEKNLSLLPNWCYSVALAKFKLEHKQNNSTTTTTTKTTKNNKKDISSPIILPPIEELPIAKRSADELLQHALMLFPMILAPLAKKANISLTNVDPNTKYTEDLTRHPYFVDFAVNPPSLQHLITLFVERNFTLWKDPDVSKWLKQNVQVVIQNVEKGDQMVSNFATVLTEEYVNAPKDLFNHLLLSEYTDNISANALPAEVANALRHGGAEAELYQGFQQAVARPAVHATTTNPLQLFLSTLLPWNEVPNAPPLNDDASNNVINNLMHYLFSQQGEQGQAQEPEEQD